MKTDTSSANAALMLSWQILHDDLTSGLN